LLRSVTNTVVAYPVKHIQNLGGKKGKLEQFLFHIDTESITLLPGVAYCLRRFQPLVQQLSRSQWIDHIKRNKQNTTLLGQDNDLESFLFETSRQSLVIVQTGLRKISNKCFYCGNSVKEADVDHFIPHSLYPRDLAHNFVLADPATGELVVSFSMLTVNADEHVVMRQFHKPGDEKRTPVIIPQENYIQWLGADVPTATQMLSWANMPALQAAPQPITA
jgi:hypothetical protein